MALPLAGAAPPPGDVLEVTLVDSDGMPLPEGQSVTATVIVPVSNTVLETVQVGRGMTNAQGVVKVDLGTSQPWLARVPDDAPSVSIQFEAPGVYHSVQYQPPSVDNGQWTLDPRNGLDDVEDTPTGVQDADTGAWMDDSGRLTIAGSFAGVGPQRWCQNRYGELSWMRWRYTGEWERRMIPVVRTYTRHRTLFKYEWQTTEETSFGVVLKAPDEPWQAGGGLEESRVNQSVTGGDHVFAKRTHRLLRMAWEWRRYRGVCWDPQGDPHPTRWRRWESHRYTGGSDKPVPSSSIWACNNRWREHHVTRTLYTENTEGVRFTRWFRIAGVEVTTRQANSERTRQTLIKATKRPFYFSCGDGAHFVNAARGREVLA